MLGWAMRHDAEGARGRHCAHRVRRRLLHLRTYGWMTLFRTRSPAGAFPPVPTSCHPPRAPFSPCVAWSASARPDSPTHHADFDCDFACGLRKLSRDSQRPFSSPSFWRCFHFNGTIFRRLRRAMGQLYSYAFNLNSRHSSRRSCIVLLTDALPLCFHFARCGCASMAVLGRVQWTRPALPVRVALGHLDFFVLNAAVLTLCCAMLP